MMNIHWILVLVATVLFGLKAFGVNTKVVDLGWAGACVLGVSMLI